MAPSGMLFDHKKEQNDTYYNMNDLENIRLSESRQSLKIILIYCMILHIQTGKSVETESVLVVA